jgi:predicted membrane protein
MASYDDRNLERENYREQRRSSSWGPIVPIHIVATVLLVIVDRHSDASDRHFRPGESTFSDSAFLGGIERKYNSSTFRQGEAEAFMGGVDLDFRDAIIEGDEARLEISAIMGGVKIRIPRNWNVANRVSAVMGGVKDYTTSTATGNKRLVIEGTVLMGALEIYN